MELTSHHHSNIEHSSTSSVVQHLPIDASDFDQIKYFLDQHHHPLSQSCQPVDLKNALYFVLTELEKKQQELTQRRQLETSTFSQLQNLRNQLDSVKDEYECLKCILNQHKQNIMHLTRQLQERQLLFHIYRQVETIEP